MIRVLILVAYSFGMMITGFKICLRATNGYTGNMTTIMMSSIPSAYSDLPVLNDSPDYNYVVSTASRGIGLEFAKQLLFRTCGHVICFSRCAEVPALKELENKFGSRMSIVPIDLESQGSIDNAISQVGAICDQRKVEWIKGSGKVDVLFNVAALLGDQSESAPGPERSVLDVERWWLEKSMQVNLISHIMVTKGLSPYLKRPRDVQMGKVVNLSARVGSIGDNGLGGWLSYRCTKSALNQFTKTVSLELKRANCIAISIHPGTTDTDLSKPFQKNVKPAKLFSTEFSVSQMLDVVFNQIEKDDGGKFYAYDGSEIEY